MKPKSKLGLTIFSILFSIALVAAQVDQCTEIIQTAIETVEEYCSVAERNEACYGNVALTAEAQPDASDFTFEDVGDITEVAMIQRLQLAGLDVENDIWGVALLRVQANIPNTLPGQNVTVMLFGDSEIINAATSTAAQEQAEQSEYGPMQAFYFTTGIGQTDCNEVPDDGMLIQTPDGVASIDLFVNEVEVNMGSTIFFTVNAQQELGVYALEGAVRVTAGGETQTSVAGSQVSIPLDDDLTAAAAPSEIESYEDNETLEYLPVAALERNIEVAPPLSPEELALFQQYDFVFENINIEDVDAVFNYVVDNSESEDFDIVQYLVEELGYTDFSDELETHFETDLGYDLSGYPDYTGAADSDADGVADDIDNCPSVANADQTDSDSNGIGDACESTDDTDSDGVADDIDNCPSVANADQTDSDSNSIGDACETTDDTDSDADGVADSDDNCPFVANPDQLDSDVDGIGDACEAAPVDSDLDGVPDSSDNCPFVANSTQTDSDFDGIGDACDVAPVIDSDGDGLVDGSDNCPYNANPAQTDTDFDGAGDACDAIYDMDGDTVLDGFDNCPGAFNPTQIDTDSDGIGDACDVSNDIDGDMVLDGLDNCPYVFNTPQTDSDSDGIGNACDSTPQPLAGPDSDGDGVIDINDVCPLLGSRGFGVAANGCPPNVVLPPDDRVNWQYGDLFVVLYSNTNGVEVYCFDGDMWVGTAITQSLVNNWDTSLSQSVPVLTVNQGICHWAFYILDSGEYQINVWTVDGKLYEIIADNLRFDGATKRYFDPNE